VTFLEGSKLLLQDLCPGALAGSFVPEPSWCVYRRRVDHRRRDPTVEGRSPPAASSRSCRQGSAPSRRDRPDDFWARATTQRYTMHSSVLGYSNYLITNGLDSISIRLRFDRRLTPIRCSSKALRPFDDLHCNFKRTRCGLMHWGGEACGQRTMLYDCDLIDPW